jgi:hypothetical protein
MQHSAARHADPLRNINLIPSQQHSAARHADPLRNINLIPNQQVFDLTLNAACLTEKQHIPIV